MATSIFHGITKSYGRTFCGRLDAYMIIIYTTAKTPQTLTRLSLSLSISLSPSHFIFLSGVQHLIGSFPFLLPSPCQHNHQDHQNRRRHFCVCSRFSPAPVKQLNRNAICVLCVLHEIIYKRETRNFGFFF
jgi:hypothetical protein